MRESLVSDIPGGDGRIANLFLQCMQIIYSIQVLGQPATVYHISPAFYTQLFQAFVTANVGLTDLYKLKILLSYSWICRSVLLLTTFKRYRDAIYGRFDGLPLQIPIAFLLFSLKKNPQSPTPNAATGRGGGERERRGFLDDVTELVDYPSPHLHPPPLPPSPPHTCVRSLRQTVSMAHAG